MWIKTADAELINLKYVQRIYCDITYASNAPAKCSWNAELLNNDHTVHLAYYDTTEEGAMIGKRLFEIITQMHGVIKID